MEAQLIVSKVENKYKDYAEPEDVIELQDYHIRYKIQAITDAQIRTYFATTGAAVMKKLRV